MVNDEDIHGIHWPDSTSEVRELLGIPTFIRSFALLLFGRQFMLECAVGSWTRVCRRAHVIEDRSINAKDSRIGLSKASYNRERQQARLRKVV